MSSKYELNSFLYVDNEFEENSIALKQKKSFSPAQISTNLIFTISTSHVFIYLYTDLFFFSKKYFLILEYAMIY
jgi:hypothetical protein